MISIDLSDNISKIERDISNALIKDINTHIDKAKNRILQKLKSRVVNWVTSQKESISLQKSGQAYSLNSLFGIPRGQNPVPAIAKAVADSTSLEFKKLNSNFVGGVSFNFQPESLSNLLSLPEGYVNTEGGSSLHWLDWLLTQGDTVVIVGYSYTASREGRSGIGEMVSGGSFRVPPEFSGSIKDNFITRAFSDREQEVTRIIKEELK